MALGILSFYGQMLLTRALQAEEAALVSVTRSASEVFFAFLFQVSIVECRMYHILFTHLKLIKISPSITDHHISEHTYHFIDYRCGARYFGRHADLRSKVRHRPAGGQPCKTHILVHLEMILTK